MSARSNGKSRWPRRFGSHVTPSWVRRVGLGALGLSTLGLGTASLTGCYDLAAQPDAGPTAGTAAIGGQIMVQTAQSAPTGNAMRQVAVNRRAVADAFLTASAPAVSAQNAPVVTGRKMRAPEPVSERLSDAVLEPQMQWRPGELVAFFDKERHDALSALSAVEDAMDRTGLSAKYRVELESCQIRAMCRFYVADADGALLEEGPTREVAKALHAAKPAGINAVTRNFMLHAFAAPNDEYFPLQWHYQFARLPAAWDITTGSDDVIVAVVDSGLNFTHPDLVNRSVPGADMISNPATAGDGGGRDPDAEDAGDDMFGPGQHSWHGTHVAGTVAASTNNQIGIAGVMWQGKVQPVRVLGRGGGDQFDIIAGIFWALGEPEIPDAPPNASRAKIINLSLGGVVDAETAQGWQQLMTRALNSPDEYGNPIIVAAAGNENQNVANIVPGSIDAIMTVGAVRYDGVRASYSNWGTAVDIMGPGGQTDLDQNGDELADGVLSTVGTQGAPYAFEHGTSMAAPHVAGILGLAVSMDSTLTQAEANQLVVRHADRAGQCNEGCGAGYINAAQMMVELNGGVTPPEEPRLILDANRISFVPGQDSATVSLLNVGGTAAPYFASIAGAQAPLFTVTPPDGVLDPATGQVLTVQLNRNGFSEGSARLVIAGAGAAAGQGGTVSLSFAEGRAPGEELRVASVGAFQLDSGANYVAVGQPVLARKDEDFRYQIAGLPAGDYFIFAVGDDNNDGVFDSNRETFGAWPIASAPQPVTVTDGQIVSNLNIALRANFGATDGVGQVGAPCTTNEECTFATDAVCISAWPSGYCSRTCDDGVCGGGGTCEQLECAEGPCNVCLDICTASTQCRQNYTCDGFGTCTPQGF